MSDHDTHTTTNTVEEGANVGFQAGQVHNSSIYVSSPEDPPERTYQVGVNYLTNGVPLKAREMINEALARGHDDTEVRFHWALAMLSKRSYRELTSEERAQLTRLPQHLARFARDGWTRALETLCELLAHLENPDCDPASTMAKLRNLPPHQREKIEQHCDLVLTGGVKDALWAEARRAAQQQQRAGDRADRVWAYFKPDPAHARVRHPAPNSTTARDHLHALLASALLISTLGYLGWLLLGHTPLVPAIAYFTMLVAGAVAARMGFEWRYRIYRFRAKEREIGYFAPRDPPEGGFADRVDGAFQHYAYLYVPKDADRSTWLAETRGIRATLRDEVVELYREDRISYEKITWLIRYLLKEINQQWSKNVLFAHRQQYRTPSSTKIGCLSATALGVLAACNVGQAAVQVDPFLAIAALLVIVGTGRAAALRWWHILSERRRFDEQTRESNREKEARENAHRKWKDKLDAARPTDKEMETWLRCDRLLLIDEALRHYHLSWRDITAHTIVQTPVKGAKRARVQGGPWRYSKYELRLFLLTTDGVRELAKQLDVEEGTFHGCERGHFRFEAVSSLRVVESGHCGYALDLTLSNGPTRTIEVTEPGNNSESSGFDEEASLARISLDSTGFTHALHVLEGIAAEGKAWIRHDAAKTHHGIGTPGNEATTEPRGAATREPQRIS